MSNLKEVLRELDRLAGTTADVEGMARFGIRSKRVLGIRVPVLRRLARRYRRDHELARGLWRSGIFEARLLAAMVEDPAQVTSAQLESWVLDLDNWAICDGCCSDLFRLTRFVDAKIRTWSRRRPEYVKRAAFSLIAEVAVHDPRATDRTFRDYLSLIERASGDDRPYVRKGVNWALRQIGKRSESLNRLALRSVDRIAQQGSRSARWIASDAHRELTSEAVQTRLARRAGR